MYKKQKIEMMIEVTKPIYIGELHAPNLLSAYKNENQVCRESAQINQIFTFKF